MNVATYFMLYINVLVVKKNICVVSALLGLM